MALSPDKVTTIQTLLQEAILSKREIARRTGVSRVTIDRIEKKLLFPEEGAPQIKIMHFSGGDDHLSEEAKPEYERCPGCRGMQQKGVPCLVCQIRKLQTQQYDCYMEDLLTPQIVSPLSLTAKASVAKPNTQPQGKTSGKKRR